MASTTSSLVGRAVVAILSAARRAALQLPGALQIPLRNIWQLVLRASSAGRPRTKGFRYLLRIAAEKAIFENQIEVHDLPPISHYWSNTHLRPILEVHGFSNPDQFFLENVKKSVLESTPGNIRILSIGSGNCDTEIRLAQSLRNDGLNSFIIECVDINERMFERASVLARSLGVYENLEPMIADFNSLKLLGPYDAVIANQSLHHVVELEHLFDQIDESLKESGRFIISDMIGRNGHQRWPEALVIVNEIWDSMPQRYKYNKQFKRVDDKFVNWDSSGVGFEGIRSQDILPELIKRFPFEFFIGYGNVIDVFIDRSFGPNLDPDNPEDRTFIDNVHKIDVSMFEKKELTPTHMLAVLRRNSYKGSCTIWNGMLPADCVRRS